METSMSTMEEHYYYTCRQQISTKQVHCLISTEGYRAFEYLFDYSAAKKIAVPQNQCYDGTYSRHILAALFGTKAEDVRFG